MQSALMDDFSKGLDLVSSLNTIAPGYTPNATNFRIADYGGIEKVLGYSTLATLTDTASDLFYFEKRDGTSKAMIAVLPTSWVSVNSAGTSTAIRTGLTTATDTTFVVYEDKLYGLDAQNIMASWDGTTLTTFATGATTGPNKGIILGVWSNRMYVAKATAGAIGMRVEWSDPGDFTKWTATNFVELGGPGTSDRIIGGVPTSDGLVILTSRSTYMLYDSATGANRVVDPRRGCSSRRSIAILGDTIYGFNREGLFATNGAFAQEIVSPRVAPLFSFEAPTLSAAAGVAWYGSYLGSYQRFTGVTNNLTLELREDTGSIMAFQYPAYAWAQGPLNVAHTLYFIDATDRTKIRQAFSGGSFAGTAISCYYETAPDSLGDEAHQKRIHRVRVVGRGSNLYVGIKTDYEAATRDTAPFTFPALTGGVWDTSLWDSAVWGGYALADGWARIQARGRRHSFRFYESSTDTSPYRDVLDSAPGSDLGACGVYLVEPHYSTSSRIR